jgi:hypothetical protein
MIGDSRPRPRQRSTTPQMLGTYPVPALRLVGTGLPPGPHAPSRWNPASFPMQQAVGHPMQHGVDYTFACRRGLVPVRWRPEAVIAVRLTSEASSPPIQGSADAVDTVVAELRKLTGLDLRAGRPLTSLIDIRWVPEQEIHVAYLPSTDAQRARRLAGDRIPGGGAAPAQGSAWYQRGWASVDTDLAIGPPAPLAGELSTALSASGLAVLRHQLCHALGLGHAARRQVLMHQRIPLDLDGYSRGDRYGLALLGDTRTSDTRPGDTRPVPYNPQAPLVQERTIPCC